MKSLDHESEILNHFIKYHWRSGTSTFVIQSSALNWSGLVLAAIFYLFSSYWSLAGIWLMRNGIKLKYLFAENLPWMRLSLQRGHADSEHSCYRLHIERRENPFRTKEDLWRFVFETLIWKYQYNENVANLSQTWLISSHGHLRGICLTHKGFV